MEEFKRGIHGAIRRKLMETKHQLSSIEQWYDRTIALDRNWRESRRGEERLRERRDNRALVPRLNNIEAQ